MTAHDGKISEFEKVRLEDGGDLHVYVSFEKPYLISYANIHKFIQVYGNYRRNNSLRMIQNTTLAHIV